ncbi:MAG: ribonucleoside-diphosphate reductase, adenosylcobalamin-dependent, partial [Methanothrix sp.]
MIKSIRKRDGSVEPFREQRIESAIARAFRAVGDEPGEAAAKLAGRVVAAANLRFPAPDSIPGVEDIQDMVEKALIEEGYAKAAKAYILYRQKRAEVREAKRYLGVADDLKLSVNAVEVLKKRYLRRDELGVVIETPGDMFERVARLVSLAEGHYGGDVETSRLRFLKAMRDLDFLPNSPTLMNAGLPLGQLSACFVLPVEDSLSGI